MPDVLDALLAFALALLVVWIATPVVKAMAWRIGAIDEPRERGLHQMPTRASAASRSSPACSPPGSCSFPRTSRRAGILIGATVIVAVGVGGRPAGPVGRT